MQHNRFGEADMSQFANVLSTHKGLEYLDISQNRITNREFIKLYRAV